MEKHFEAQEIIKNLENLAEQIHHSKSLEVDYYDVCNIIIAVKALFDVDEHEDTKEPAYDLIGKL